VNAPTPKKRTLFVDVYSRLKAKGVADELGYQGSLMSSGLGLDRMDKLEVFIFGVSSRSCWS
jgi:hypothetical protein